MAIPPDRNMHSDKGSPSTSEGRKSSKPIMEKRRRARINASLSELKSLLLEVIKKEGSRHSKMEKADILEMTVKHLRQLQRQQFTGSPKTDSNVLNNYRLGFEECAQEVTRYLSQMEVCDVELRSRILNHLASSVSSGIFNPSPPTTPVSTVTSQPTSSSPSMSLPSMPLHSAPVLAFPSVFNSVLPEPSTNAMESITSMASASPSVSQPVQMTKVVSGVQLIPTKMQSGEVAFVLPGNIINSGGQIPSYIIPVYPQQSTETTPQPSIVPSTISASTIISQMPVLQVAPPPLPILTKPPVVDQNSFVTFPSKQPMLTLPISEPFRSIPLFTPRPSQPPSSTVTSQRPVDPRPMMLPNVPPDSIRNQIRPDLPRDNSMWRPW